MSGEPNSEKPEHQLEGDDHKEAQEAADGLKGQIAALRARVQDAQDTLREHERRKRETRTFKR